MKRKSLLPLRNLIPVFILITFIFVSFQKTSAQEIFSLPFNEGWTSGNFSLNNWRAGQNWSVFGQMGYPLPAVKFQWDPILENYFSSLESRSFGIKTGNGTSERSIWLGFNIALKDRTSSGNEKLIVEVWNGKQWDDVVEFQNNGSFGWIAQNIDITKKNDKTIFKIRFAAMGKSSRDISYWMIDNVTLTYGPGSVLFSKSPLASQNIQKINLSSPPLKNESIASKDSSNIHFSSMLSTKNHRDLVGYNIYRRQFIDPIPGGYSTYSNWTRINDIPVITTNYWDLNLPNNSYDYYVTAVYDEGESNPSNIDAWNWIGWPYGEMIELLISGILLYPNPVSTYLEIDFPKNINYISIYNSMGSVLCEKPSEGATHTTIQTSEYPSGVYFVKLSDSSGNTFIRKFLVAR